jgi:hypothetical protein
MTKVSQKYNKRSTLIPLDKRNPLLSGGHRNRILRAAEVAPRAYGTHA